MTHLTVVAWTDHFLGEAFLAPRDYCEPDGSQIQLEFTQDRSRLGEADAVWFHGPSIRDLPQQKQQPWVIMSMESEVNYPALANPIAMTVFDLTMTYRLDADIPCIYPNREHYGSFLEPPPQRPVPQAGPLAVYIASNAVEHRDRYVAELMRHMPVDSLGDCLRNKQPDDFVSGRSIWGGGGWDAIVSILPHYRFYLAFENSRAEDYVTERVFHALACGVVPVYLGAPNVREFMPDDAAVIVADEFSSPRELALHLQALGEDPVAYARHLAWKHSGYSRGFERLLDLGDSDPVQRMARKLVHGCNRSCRCGGRVRGRAA